MLTLAFLRVDQQQPSGITCANSLQQTTAVKSNYLYMSYQGIIMYTTSGSHRGGVFTFVTREAKYIGIASGGKCT